MRRRNRSDGKKEKMVMLLSSVFVLAGLTATGLFLKTNQENKNDGYVVDFSSIEDESKTLAGEQAKGGGQTSIIREAEQQFVNEDDLDYDPNFREANSIHVESQEEVAAKAKEEEEKKKAIADKAMLEEMEGMEDQEALATTIQPVLTFGDGDSLAWPIVGNVLINYSMDKTVFFPTLQQYKYNPAIIISAVENEMITAAADGKVTRVYDDPALGTVIVMELGGGYEVTYGQLKDVTVSEGGYVTKGDMIGSVAAPTKYYVTEGCNIYFKLSKDGVPMNPMSKLK